MLPLAAHEFALGFDKYDIAADLDDAAPREHIVILAPEQPEQLRAPRRNEGDDTPLGIVKLHIADITEAEARVYIYDLLIPQLGKIADHATHPLEKSIHARCFVLFMGKKSFNFRLAKKHFVSLLENLNFQKSSDFFLLDVKDTPPGFLSPYLPSRNFCCIQIL